MLLRVLINVLMSLCSNLGLPWLNKHAVNVWTNAINVEWTMTFRLSPYSSDTAELDNYDDVTQLLDSAQILRGLRGLKSVSKNEMIHLQDMV